LRGNAVVAERAHNPLVVGANPTLATKLRINYFEFGRFETSDWLWCKGAHWPRKVSLTAEIRAGGGWRNPVVQIHPSRLR